MGGIVHESIFQSSSVKKERKVVLAQRFDEFMSWHMSVSKGEGKLSEAIPIEILQVRLFISYHLLDIMFRDC